MRSRCSRSIITTSAPAQRLAHAREDVDAEPLDAGRQQGGGRDHAHARAHRGEEQDVRARHARMGDVAADRHDQAGEAALVAADGQRVEQRLGRMLVRAVAGIDDGALDLLREQRDGAGGMVADDEQVRPHGVQRHRRVDQRLALLHRRGGDRHVHDVGAEALAGELEGGLRAGRGFEEEVDLRAAAQRRLLLLDLAADVDGGFGRIEEECDILGGKALDAEKVPVRELRMPLKSHL